MSRIEKEIIIKNKEGLHARPAALFVQTASKYDSVVRLKNKQDVVDGKSIMGILSLGAECGNKILLIVDGEDSQQAIGELEKILTQNE